MWLKPLSAEHRPNWYLFPNWQPLAPSPRPRLPQRDIPVLNGRFAPIYVIESCNHLSRKRSPV
jgi:hypothetical protein